MISRRLHNLLHPKVGEIWMLHRVVEHLSTAAEEREMEVEQAYLAQRIDAALAQGANFCPIAEVPNHIAQRVPFICLTFDDGYLDTLSLALPLLRERGLPFCVYLTRDFYQGAAHPYWSSHAPMLNAEQVQQLADKPLCTVGLHTCSHPRLASLTPDEQRREIAESKADLESLVGHTVQHIAYPHGSYNATTLAICRELGISTGVAANGRTIRTDSRRLELDRVGIHQS